MQKAFEIVNRLENPLMDTNRALNVAKIYLSRVFETLVEDDRIDRAVVETAEFAIDQVEARLCTAIALHSQAEADAASIQWEAMK